MSDTIVTRLLRGIARAWTAQVRAYQVLERRREPWEDAPASAPDRELTVTRA